MPIPAILAALARAGAAIAARAGAGGAARSLVGMARAAGPAAARRAAAKLGAQDAARGSAAAATHAAESAAEGLHVGPGNALGLGGPRVLEDTRLTNARAMFQAIHGQTPPAGTTAGVAAAPSSQVQAAASAAQQSAASQTAAQAAPQGGGISNWARSYIRDGHGFMGGGIQPHGPVGAQSSTGILDKFFDAAHRVRDIYHAAQQRFTPIAEQVANMTVDQRYERLEKGGKLSNIADVARQYSTPNPSREQQVQHGEAEEERQRQEEISNSRSARVGQAVWGAGKRSLVGALAMATPAGAATMPVWMYGVVKGFEALGRTISDSNRDLRQFNSRISDSFARLDYAQLRSRQRVATATSGSASFLNDELVKLTRELQPIRQSVASMLNLWGAGAARIARILTFLAEWHPAFILLNKVLVKIEKSLDGKKEEEVQAALKDFLKAQRDGTFKMPTARKPGENGGASGSW